MVGVSYRGPVIDVHTHVTQIVVGRDRPQGAEALRRLSAEAGVTRAGVLVMAHANEPEETRRGNDDVLAVARDSGGLFYPVGSVHPQDDWAFEELDRLVGLGMRWLKLHPNTQGFDVADPSVAELIERCGTLGMTVLFDAYSPFDPGQPGKFLQLAMAHPTCRIVLAHMFGPRFADALAYAILREQYPDQRPAVWFDLSAVAPMFAGGPFAEQLTYVIRKVGVEWFLFGSDFPFHTPSEALAAVRSLGLTDDEERAILHDNAAALPMQCPQS
jgi:predicted TIM-barrel fold metal-dependent hydrolase